MSAPDVFTYFAPRIDISLRASTGRVVGRARNIVDLAMHGPPGTYVIEAVLSRGRIGPGFRARRCRTRVKATRGSSALVTLVIGQGYRCGLYASDSSARVRVPNVSGLYPEDANCVLRAAGLRMRVYGNGGGLGQGCPASSQRANIIPSAQRPAAGSVVARGTLVALALSCGDLPNGCGRPRKGRK